MIASFNLAYLNSVQTLMAVQWTELQPGVK